MVLPPIATLCWVTDCSALAGSGAGFLVSSPAGLSAARAAPPPSSTAAVIMHTSVLFTDFLLGWLQRWRSGRSGGVEPDTANRWHGCMLENASRGTRVDSRPGSRYAGRGLRARRRAPDPAAG